MALGLLPALPAAAAVAAPGDSVRDTQQWVFNMMNVPPAWQVTEGSGVTVAVIDSGVYPDVSDLSGGTVIAGPDFTGLHTSPQNPNWGQHGTWMASIIAGHGTTAGRRRGDRGIAPAAKVLSIRVIPDKGDPGYQAYNNEPENRIQDELADGIMTAVKDHAQVISMSIGYSAPSGVVRDAITYAYQHGTVLVASSGNSGDNDTQHGKSSSRPGPGVVPRRVPGRARRGRGHHHRHAGQLLQRQPLRAGRRAGQGRPRPGTERPLLHRGRHEPGVRARGRRRRADRVQVPEDLPGAGDGGADDHRAAESRRAATTCTPGSASSTRARRSVKAGQLMKERPHGSQVPLTAHFGGGPAAVPAAPVAPRGDGQRLAFIALALVSLVGRARRARRGHAGPARRAGSGDVTASEAGAEDSIDDYSAMVLDVVDAIPPGR